MASYKPYDEIEYYFTVDTTEVEVLADMVLKITVNQEFRITNFTSVSNIDFNIDFPDIEEVPDYLDDIVLPDNIYYILVGSYTEENPGIYATSITRNITTNDIKLFTDYFIVEYGSDKVLMNVYSDNTNTYVKFTKLDHNISMLIASSANKTEGNKTVFEIINEIDNKLGNTEDMTLTSWTNPSDTQTDTNGIIHNYYEVGSVTYDVFTKDSIEYVRYTTK